MHFYSTNNTDHTVSLSTAVLAGLAPDGGLYMPSEFNALPSKWLDTLQGSDLSLHQIGIDVFEAFFGNTLPESIDLKTLMPEALNFDMPLKKINHNTYILEQWHGPTGAFKDVGARVMARFMQALRDKEKPTTILVATSGDTGGAVASGFYNVPGINVVILYPSGGVSDLQEKQLTTLGNNIHALEVDGTFDDCQAVVKQAMSDQALVKQFGLGSANSINIARLLPQMLYYFRAIAQLPKSAEAPLFVVPSGNFGNICAGLFAEKIGMKTKRFVAATNANDIVPHYLATKSYTPRPSVKTHSNAMDVGNPSNMARILDLYNNDHDVISQKIWAHLPGITDQQTLRAIEQMHKEYKYEMDPHGAVGYTSLLHYRLATEDNSPAIIFETAHPSKFNPVMIKALGKPVKVPVALEAVLNKEKIATRITPKLDNLLAALSEL